jgi:mannose-6-phosphate isomerase
MACPVYRLKCGVNNYPWGKQGDESLVALLRQQTPDFHLDKHTNYSELLVDCVFLCRCWSALARWMGMHPKQPSTTIPSGQNLADLITHEPEMHLGRNVVEAFGAELPFILKVLSVGKALPLQTHPVRLLAACHMKI